MAELIILHSAVFAVGLAFGFWLGARRRQSHSFRIYAPPANSAGSTPRQLSREDRP